MATVTKLQVFNDEIKILFSDGSHILAFYSNSIYIPQNNTNGIKYLKDYGNIIAINYTDGTINLAYPTGNSLFVTKGTYSPGPTWIWPVHYRADGVTKWNLGDGYGSRISPITGLPEFHYGQDINGSGINNWPIVAPSHGVVQAVGTNPSASYGYNVHLSHDDGTGTFYGHMIALPPVSVGQIVNLGDHIGNVGATGDATGPHLHYNTQTVYASGANSNTQDPLIFMSSKGAPW